LRLRADEGRPVRCGGDRHEGTELGGGIHHSCENQLMTVAGSFRAGIVMACWMLLTTPGSAGELDLHVPEPAGLWSGPMGGETPPTLQGAQVVDVPALERLLPEKPLLIDVRPPELRPK